MKPAKIATLALLLGASFLVGRSLNASSPPPKPNVKNLMQQPLDTSFTPGREVLVDLVQIPPNTALDRHWHPGEEFHYYLEGEVEIQLEGQPSIVGRPGTVGHVPFRKLHKAVAGRKGAKVLVFRVHTSGEPWRYLEGEGAAEH